MPLTLRGAIEPGTGEAAAFMRVDWVRRAVAATVGFDPYPGTLNVRLVDGDTIEQWRRIRQEHGRRLTPPPGETCGARLVPVVVSTDVPAAVIVPDVTRYGAHVLEVVAAVHLRTRLWLRDHDVISLTWTEPPVRSRRRGDAPRLA